MDEKLEKVKSQQVNLDQQLSFVDRHGILILWAILALSLALRIFALLSLKETIYWDYLVIDEKMYHQWAEKIADGSFASSSIYEFSPLPAYLMALVYKIFSPDIFYIRIMNIIFGVFTCYFIFLIGRELGDRKTGLLACLIAALYEPFIFYSVVPLKTSLAVFLFSVTIYFFLSVLSKRTAARIFLLGLASGLTLYVRPNYALIVPVVPIIILLMYRGQIPMRAFIAMLVLYAIGLSLPMSPTMIRNYRVAGELAMTTSQAGQNLYNGNYLENADPYYRPVPFASSDVFEQGTQFTIEASRRESRKMSAMEASDYWVKDVAKTALERPKDFALKIGRKTMVLFNSFEAGDHYHIGFISDFAKFFKLPFLNFWLILPLGMAGMLTSILQSRKSLALSIVFAIYGLTLIVFFTNMRYRLPLLVILIPFAALGINNLLTFIKDRQLNRIGVYLAVAVVFLIVEFLPIRATGDLTSYNNIHAAALYSKEMKDEAVSYWEKSSSLAGSFSVGADLVLGGHYASRRDFEKAWQYLEKIPDSSFVAAGKYELIGDIMTVQGRTLRAIESYGKSLEINSGQRRVRSKLVERLKSTDPVRASDEYEKLIYISSFYD